MTMADNQIRTTVYLDENLYLTAKKKAVEERTTLTGLIKKGLKDQLKTESRKKNTRRKLNLLSFNLGTEKNSSTYRREEIYDEMEF